MSLVELKGFLIDLIARTKPVIESLVVGALMAALEALWAAYNSGQVLSGRTVLVILLASMANYLTSKARRIQAKQVGEEAVRATLAGARMREQLHAVGQERDMANKVVEKQQARLERLEGA